VPIRVEHSGYWHDRWLAEPACNIIDVSLLVLDVQMKLLQICGLDGDRSATSLVSV
jgi:hypothetical protein